MYIYTFKEKFPSHQLHINYDVPGIPATIDLFNTSQKQKKIGLRDKLISIQPFDNCGNVKHQRKKSSISHNANQSETSIKWKIKKRIKER